MYSVSCWCLPVFAAACSTYCDLLLFATIGIFVQRFPVVCSPVAAAIGRYVLLFIAICCYWLLLATICCYLLLLAAICCYLLQFAPVLLFVA